MTVRLVRGARWAPLVSHLAEGLAAAATGPFQKLRVVVATRATGRVVGQQVAAQLGISAGIAYLSPTDLLRRLAEVSGAGRDLSRWYGTPLDLAVADALAAVPHPLVERAMAPDDARPGRRRATATRLAQLLRSYLDHAPQLLEQWLAGSDEGLDGAPLPDELSWQPPLFRAASTALELDPLAVHGKIEAAARQDTTPTFVLAVDHLTRPQHRTLAALAEGPGLTILQLRGSPGDSWAGELATSTLELPGEAAPAPEVSVHDSHGASRQVDVLRDELTRAFAQDPTLEPRDVVIVCPQPERFAGALEDAFSPADEGTHPGRTLRLQSLATLTPNRVLHVLVRLLRLGSSRATATDLVDLVLSPPIAHRWRLTDRRAVIELVSGSGVRWGLDERHRAEFGLADVEQNTWLRGIDRLLIGLAVAPGQDAGLGLSGTDAVSASDLPTVGALSEVLARLRQVVAGTATSATVPEWVERARHALASLIGLPYAEQWQELHALAVLARLESDHRGHPTQLTPSEFAHLLADEASPPRARVAAGNGTLQVLPLGELQHVEFRVVALLGVTDDVLPGRGGRLPDSVDLGDRAPEVAARRLHQLLTHARAAEQLIIVRQAGSPRTNDPVALPVAVSWLLEQLGLAPEPVAHPPTATSAANFGPRPSFDAPAHAGAQARLSSATTTSSLTARRRTAARTRPVGAAPPQLTLTQLERFLADPAKAFLRAAGGIPLYAEPQVSDEVPLVVGGLAHWQIVNALVESWKKGTTLSSVEEHFLQREDLPPKAIGEAAFNTAKEEATALWKSAREDWFGAQATHAIDLKLPLGEAGEVRLVDEVRTRNGLALAANPSQSATGILRPWLESLALAAQGIAVPAKLHHFVKNRDTNFRISTGWQQVDPLRQQQALAHLATVAGAYAWGQSRLLPVPAGPGLTFAREHAAGRFRPADWSGPITDFRGKWSSVGPAWQLFYAADVRELFEDSPLPEDPSNGLPSAFQAWAWALYAPLAGGAA